MTKLILFIGLMVGIPLSATAASYPCDKAVTAVEKQICENETASQLDSELASVYKKAVTGPDAKVIRERQRFWIRFERNACSTSSCLIQSYQSRLQELTIVTNVTAPRQGITPDKPLAPQATLAQSTASNQSATSKGTITEFPERAQLSTYAIEEDRQQSAKETKRQAARQTIAKFRRNDHLSSAYHECTLGEGKLLDSSISIRKKELAGATTKSQQESIMLQLDQIATNRSMIINGKCLYRLFDSLAAIVEPGRDASYEAIAAMIDRNEFTTAGLKKAAKILMQAPEPYWNAWNAATQGILQGIAHEMVWKDFVGALRNGRLKLYE